MVYTALSYGKPVIGIPSNIDQYYLMGSMEQKKTGICIRSENANKKTVLQAVETLLSDPEYKRNAGSIAGHIACYDPVNLTADSVERVTETQFVPDSYEEASIVPSFS